MASGFRTKLLAALAVLGAVALIAAACTGGDDSAGGADGADGTPLTEEEGTPQAEDRSGDDEDLEGEIPVVARSWNTNWSKRTIDLDELIAGSIREDPRDAIPPIDDPVFETIAEANEWLDDREPVVQIQVGDDVRAYPLRIMTSHEVVNDVVGGEPVVVTYCPLCNSAVAFERTIEGQVFRFGVSGLLRNSDLVMWDRQTESLWQQITGEAIVGDMVGAQLEFVPAALVSWADFKQRFPDGETLSRDQGIYPAQVYDSQPYVGYDSSSDPFLFRGETDDRFPAMERVVAVRLDGVNKAYPFSVISDELAVNDEVAGTPVLVVFGSEDTASALDQGDVAASRAVGVGLAFGRTVEGQVLTFEPQGEDRFVDQETGTIWNLFGEAMEGQLAGQELEPVVHTNELWFAWAAFNEGAPVYTGAGA